MKEDVKMKYYLFVILFSFIAVGFDYFVIRLFSQLHSGPFLYVIGGSIILWTLMMNRRILVHLFPEHYVFIDELINDEENKKTDKDDKSVSP